MQRSSFCCPIANTHHCNIRGFYMVFRKYPLRKLFACGALALSLVLCTISGRLTDAAPVSAAGQEAQLVQYLAAYGWEVDSSSAVTEEVTLPETFGAAYDSYLACQHACGFALENYAGKTVLRWTCPVTNYPTGEGAVYADLLLLEGEVIGGDIRCAELAGFLQSLAFPEE